MKKSEINPHIKFTSRITTRDIVLYLETPGAKKTGEEKEEEDEEYEEGEKRG